jgi:hypothetical protein
MALRTGQQRNKTKEREEKYTRPEAEEEEGI